MLINLSNHPYNNWSENQKQIAIETYGWVIDLEFPNIDPNIEFEEIEKIAKVFIEKCVSKFHEANIPVAQEAHNDAVHIMGEHTFVYVFVKLMLEKNIVCVASTTKRNLIEEKEGRKTVQFEFVKFRKYMI